MSNYLIDAATRRIDQRIDRLDRAMGQLERHAFADAAEEAEEIENKIRRDRDRCADHQRNYDAAFSKLGSRAPKPAVDERPPGYRRRMFAIGQSMLPKGHALAKFDAQDLDGSAIIPFEQQLLEALDQEAENPSGSNLPASAEDARARRERTDSMGTKTIDYHAKRSFIADMTRPARKVLRIIDPSSGRVIYGPPFPVAQLG